MSRPTPAVDGPAAAARAELPEDDRAGFDRLVHAVLASPGATKQPALGAVLRSQLPGTAGVRWLHAEGISPMSRASALTSAQWLSLHTPRLPQPPAPSPRRRRHAPPPTPA